MEKAKEESEMKSLTVTQIIGGTQRIPLKLLDQFIK